MKTRNIITALVVATVLGGCAQSRSVVTAPDNRVAKSNSVTVSKSTTFMNGIALSNGIQISNGVQLTNGMSSLALTALASRPLAKKD